MEKVEQAKSYKVVFSEKQYLKMMAANVINRFGDSIDAVAFGWLVYQLTGSKELLALIMGVNMIPTVLFQPFAGALVNYFDKKRLLVACDLGRGLLVSAIGILFLLGRLNVPLLFVITFLNSTLESLRMPCGLSVLPLILKRENFTVATSLNQSVSRASELIGMGLAGVIIATLGVGGAVLIDAVTFMGSAFILAFMHVPAGEAAAKKNYLKELKGGFQYFKGNRMIIMVTFLCCVFNFVEFPLQNLRPAYIQEGLLLGENALSVGSLTLSIGMFLGSVLYPLVSSRIAGMRMFLIAGVAIGGVYFGLVGLMGASDVITKLVAYGVVMLFYGMASSSINMALNVVMISNIESSFMARVGGIFNALACTSSPVAAFTTTLLVGLLPLKTLYIGVGVVCVVLFVSVSFTRTMREMK